MEFNTEALTVKVLQFYAERSIIRPISLIVNTKTNCSVNCS